MFLPSTVVVVCKCSPEHRTCSASTGFMLVSPVTDLDSNTVTNPQPPWSPCLSLCSRPWLLIAAGDSSSGSPVLLLLGQCFSSCELPRACSSLALWSSRTSCSHSSCKHRGSSPGFMGVLKLSLASLLLPSHN